MSKKKTGTKKLALTKFDKDRIIHGQSGFVIAALITRGATQAKAQNMVGKVQGL